MTRRRGTPASRMNRRGRRYCQAQSFLGFVMLSPRQERKQPAAGVVIERGAVFARLERFGVLGTRRKQNAKAFRLPPQPGAHLRAEPGTALGVAARHLLSGTGVIREPFVELRHVTVHHTDDLV